MPLSNSISLSNCATLASAVSAPAGVAEVTTFDFTGIDGNAFMPSSTPDCRISRAGERVSTWFHAHPHEDSPPGLPDGVDALLEVQLPEWPDPETPITENDLASTFAAALDGQGWSAAAVGPVVTVTDAAVGARVDADQGVTTIVVTVTTQGEDP